MVDDDEWLSAREAAEYTGISTTTFRNWHRNGRIGSVPTDARELMGVPFSGEQRGRRGLCFRRADLEALHVSWERGRPAREWWETFRELEERAHAAYDRWEAHAMACTSRRRQRCPIAYLAMMWGWLPDARHDNRGRLRVSDLRGPFEDVMEAGYRAMCSRGKWLYDEWLAADAAEYEARTGRPYGS